VTANKKFSLVSQKGPGWLHKGTGCPSALLLMYGLLPNSSLPLLDLSADLCQKGSSLHFTHQPAYDLRYLPMSSCRPGQSFTWPAFTLAPLVSHQSLAVPQGSWVLEVTAHDSLAWLLFSEKPSESKGKARTFSEQDFQHNNIKLFICIKVCTILKQPFSPLPLLCKTQSPINWQSLKMKWKIKFNLSN
jgi:hypothetical protein